jgi:hypothetical protein
VLGISTLEAANRYLEEIYVPFWNERFAIEPTETRDVHRRLPKRFNLERLFAETSRVPSATTSPSPTRDGASRSPRPRPAAYGRVTR